MVLVAAEGWPRPLGGSGGHQRQVAATLMLLCKKYFSSFSGGDIAPSRQNSTSASQ